MKLRLLKKGKKTFLYCMNGSIIEPTPEVLVQMLTAFSKPQAFKGTDGYWNDRMASMEDAGGETLAYVDDTNKLIILNENTFRALVTNEIKYISASEYAAKHNKSRASIKNLCLAEKLPGAYKTSAGWMIPEDTPYPADGRMKSTSK